MGLNTYAALQEQYNLLNELYDSNLGAVRQLQATLLHDILPGLVDEQGLDATAVDRTREWLADTPTIFRTLKRQNFTASFALEALQSILLWRVHVLPQVASASPSAYLTCLPPHCRDPFGRPIIVVRLGKLLDGVEDIKSILVYTVELMRSHLAQLNYAELARGQGARPILQYVMLLDIEGMTINSRNIDTFSWLVQDLLPRYPGLLGAGAITNTAPTNPAVIRRILPTSALQKVFFTTHAGLRDLLSPAHLPEDWGGGLPRITELDNPLAAYVVWPAARPSQECAAGEDAPPGPAAARQPRTVLSSTSLLNPFFGYPAVSDAFSPPTPRHGRRRKRDLVRTLLRLWWARWGACVRLAVLALALCLVLRRTRWLAALRARWRRRQLAPARL
ncbi:hypothetical protein PHLGIDRAFT_30459 [Phlebiopsis gigantea 11061_1 CR5-6]|uniref:CRAL-TRIO domain-containing protein n=1 Tax=Phlebiopsis gigantea (strain 11061_1 CR5-6) TaxID=745531 RepID=A0A0C3PJX3_PHLG1|nr:hypothetical protein PHLGIDRAFT_30459 [Phlebiopsis gigantea 11061_1 CR5-6]